MNDESIKKPRPYTQAAVRNRQTDAGNYVFKVKTIALYSLATRRDVLYNHPCALVLELHNYI
jgi:hypothetical protein